MGEMIESKMDQVLSEYNLDKLEHLAPFNRALMVARGIKQCLELIEPEMPTLLELKGTKLGFLVDKDNYDKATIKHVLVEGMLRGALPTGNEINIIGGNLYLTKEYFHRRLGAHPGLTNLRIAPGIPQVLREPRWEKVGEKNKSVPGSALVEISATWKLDGQPQSMECRKTDDRDTRIPIRLDPFYSIDQVLGKAESKLLRRIYKRITGSSWVEEDEDDKIPSLPQETQEPEDAEQLSEEMLAEIFNGIEDRAEIERQREVLCSLHTGEGEQHLINAWAAARRKELRD